MVKWLVMGALLCVAACGSRPAQTSSSSTVTGDRIGFATGPIGSACLAQRRRGASQQRCGCIQQVANGTLSQSQQKRSVKYFDDPSLLQEVRQSGSASNVRFWNAWEKFAQNAQSLCEKS